jgi:hypothetical protein
LELFRELLLGQMASGIHSPTTDELEDSTGDA